MCQLKLIHVPLDIYESCIYMLDFRFDAILAWMCRIFVQTYIGTIFTSQIKVDIAKSYFCIFFYLEKEKLAWCYITLETIRHYKVITLFFSIPINIYLYFIGKLVQQIAALAFGIVILDSFLLLYCRIDWELTRHFVWVIEEINGVVIFHLVCSFTMELHPERMMGLEMLMVQITLSNHNFPQHFLFLVHAALFNN